MGGGIGNLVSNFGLGSDNIISARVITANGSVVTASQEQNSDLFWALRGAGHNFGIVSELMVKVHRQINGGLHWSGMLGFPGSKEIAEKVVSTVQDMGLTKGQGPEGMMCTVVYGRPASTNEVDYLLKLLCLDLKGTSLTLDSQLSFLNYLLTVQLRMLRLPSHPSTPSPAHTLPA